MITFETQEDFEQAVLEIIKRKLVIGTSGGDDATVYLSINCWGHSGEYVPDDDRFSSGYLPTPSLRY